MPATSTAATAPTLAEVIASTQRDAAAVAPSAALTFQWPWDIAKRGAGYLGQHSGAVQDLVSGGQGVITSPQGPAITAAIASGPTDPANTGQVLGDGVFSDALNGVQADQLLRTVLIGWSSGAQIGVVGGSGGSGVAYDIVDQSDRNAVHYGSFNLGIGANIGVGMIVGAMTMPPASLDHSTCVWSFGASIVGIGVFVSVIMDSDDLGLIGFGINLGGGAGVSSTSGYGSISTS